MLTSGYILAFVEAGHPPRPLTVYRSRDHGRTWQTQETVIRQPGRTYPGNAHQRAWHHAGQGGGRAVLSRFPIAKLTPGRQGAVIALPSGPRLYVLKVHLAASPPQPYQLLGT